MTMKRDPQSSKVFPPATLRPRRIAQRIPAPDLWPQPSEMPKHTQGTLLAARDKGSFAYNAISEGFTHAALTLCSEGIWLTRIDLGLHCIAPVRIGLGLNCIAPVLDGNGARLSRKFDRGAVHLTDEREWTCAHLIEY